jgi:hypothetical protein
MKNHDSDFRRIKDSTYQSMPASPARSNRRRGGRIQRLADGGNAYSANGNVQPGTDRTDVKEPGLESPGDAESRLIRRGVDWAKSIIPTTKRNPAIDTDK